MHSELTKMLSRIDADYADLRYERVRLTEIKMNSRSVSHAASNETDGYVLRILRNGGFAVLRFSRAEDLERLLPRALASASLLGARGEKSTRMAPVPVVQAAVKHELGEDPWLVSFEEKLALTRHYGELALAHPQVVATHLGYWEQRRERWFASTEGARIHEPLTVVRISGEIVAQDGNNTQNVRVGFGGSNGFQTLRNRAGLVEKKRGIAIDLLKSKAVEGGTFSCILSPFLAGVFTHEAFGHYSEADLVENNPGLRSRLCNGAQLGAPCLSITADSTRPGQLGHYAYDDEGVAVVPVPLLSQGVLQGRLHSRRTAAEFGETPTGHCVAEDFNFDPIVRMGTILIEPGEQTFEDLLQQLGDGYYFLDGKGGQTSGENFTFGAQYGYRVRSGKVEGMVSNINLTGNLFDTLKNIRGVANDLQLTEVGGCGRGQMNYRSNYGAPHILVDNVVVGGKR